VPDAPQIRRAQLEALVADIGRFYITDRAMRRAQGKMSAALAAAAAMPSSRQTRAYLKEVARYFTGFAGEARVHLADLERRLGHVSQLQYNLTAERGVAVARVEATQGVLERLREVSLQ
jgi:hypothetical protein